MYTFKELKRAKSKVKQEGKEFRVAVLGNSSTQFLSLAIEGYSKLEGLNVVVYDSDYNQIDAQLIDTTSEVHEFSPDCVILWLSSDKLYEEFLDTEFEKRNSFADEYMEKIEHYWNLISDGLKCRVIQPNMTEIDDKVLGQYSCKVETSFIYQIRKLNYLLQCHMNDRSDIFPVDLLSIQVQLGRDCYYDATLYYNAKMTVSINAIPFVAKAFADVLKAMSGKIKKCVVLDLDNTIWGGVIGDDGIGGIEIGELGRGHAFSNFQRWLKQLKEYGIILAVCSKNNEDIAREPFERHDEMILRMSDISIFVANWNDKATNIQAIQESLNIGMDSIIFIDDNPFERQLVKELISEIDVPELPEDPALYLGYLQEMNYFDTVAFTGVNADRTRLYQAEFERKKLATSYDSIDDYLKSLCMKCEVRPFEKDKFARIAQLTQRSNQFNLRTVRYTEAEIENISKNDKFLTLYYTLSDKFGDYGLVSVVILEKISEEELFVNTWLMSCRVLKRGMEEFVINKMVKKAKEKGFIRISSEYIPTVKNKMVSDIYRTMGFSTTSENHYIMELSEYSEKKVFIEEE